MANFAPSSVCASLRSEASDVPKPTGAWSSFSSSYSKAHTGVWSNCDYATEIPSNAKDSFDSWTSSVDSFLSSYTPKASASMLACPGLMVQPVVIPNPKCTAGSDSSSSSGSDTSSSGTGNSKSASTTTASSSSSTSGTSAGSRIAVSLSGAAIAVAALAFGL